MKNKHRKAGEARGYLDSLVIRGEELASFLSTRLYSLPPYMQSFNYKSTTPKDISPIKKITNWLMKKSDDGEFIFRTDKNSYQQGEEVTLTGVSSESNNKLIIADGLVELYQENNFIGSKNLFFDFIQFVIISLSERKFFLLP
mgnify:CR=1 FL=1